jgi:hypothetical protein
VWRRRLLGWIWIGAWVLVLVVVHAPWSNLGGIVSERMRWYERATLGSATIAGALAGAMGRAWASRPGGPSHAVQSRWLWLPPAVLTTAIVAAAELRGDWALTLVTLVGFVSYWAGLDVAFGAWPLARGELYAFLRPIPVEEKEENAEEPYE